MIFELCYCLTVLVMLLEGNGCSTAYWGGFHLTTFRKPTKMEKRPQNKSPWKPESTPKENETIQYIRAADSLLAEKLKNQFM